MAQTAYYPPDPTLEELMRLYPEDSPALSDAMPGYGDVPDPYGLSSSYEGAPSYIPTSAVPQPTMPSQVQQLIDGMGYDPATLALMRGHAVDDVAHGAMPQLAATRRALGTAGLTNSPAGQAYVANIGRQTGDKQSEALGNIDILNANVANQNRQFGLGLAHQWAMENANRLFEAMGQNLSQSGANTRTAVSTAFGQNPYNPGSGQPQQSGVAPAILGAASQIKWPGSESQTGATPPFAEQDQSPAFSKNPYRGF